MSLEEERRARMALAAIFASDCPPGYAMQIDRQGAEEVYERLRRDEESRWGRIARTICIDAIEQSTLQGNMRFLIPGDEEWPAELGHLATVEAHDSKSYGVPLGLWVKGPLRLDQIPPRGVALVGARAASQYGNSIASSIASSLTGDEYGRCIILSGGAYGIDTAAHYGAIRSGGYSVGIYANGLDMAYPAGNGDLFEILGENHLVISEIAPGVRPTKRAFLARNRLIATLSIATVVVEAALRSGARNTASWAAELGRVICAVPGSIFSSTSIGCHQLIRDGYASLVTDAREIYALIAEMGMAPQLPQGEKPHPFDLLDVIPRTVYETLSPRIWKSVDDIALTTGFTLYEVTAALLELECCGWVESCSQGWKVARLA